MASHPELFTCTFCFHLVRGPPRILGRSVRIACESCYNTVLDLAICWVCGEVVYRGEECVSLGWCFWHRGCYGCLFCGSKRVANGPSLKELFEDAEVYVVMDPAQSNTNKSPDSLTTAKEIDGIPMCANCMVGVEDDSQETVVQKAIRRVDRTDSGLSRQRWERAATAVNRTDPGPLRSSHGWRKGATGGTNVPKELHSRKAGHGGITDIVNDAGSCVVPLESTIYVNIRDPIGLPAFKPSPTKPIPQQMQPSWVTISPGRPRAFNDPKSQVRSILDDSFGGVESETSGSSIIQEAETICPTAAQTPTRVLSPQTQRRAIEEQRIPRSLTTARYSPVGIPQVHGLSFVSTESLQRPSSVSRKNTGADTPSSRGSIMVSTPVSPHPIPSRSSSARPQKHIATTPRDQGTSATRKKPSPSLVQEHQRTTSPFSNVTAYVKSKVFQVSSPPGNDRLRSEQTRCSNVNNTRASTGSMAVAGRGQMRRVGGREQEKSVIGATKQHNDSQSYTGSPVRRGSKDSGKFSPEETHLRTKVVRARGGLKRNIAQGDLWKPFMKEDQHGQ